MGILGRLAHTIYGGLSNPSDSESKNKSKKRTYWQIGRKCWQLYLWMENGSHFYGITPDGRFKLDTRGQLECGIIRIYIQDNFADEWNDLLEISCIGSPHVVRYRGEEVPYGPSEYDQDVLSCLNDVLSSKGKGLNYGGVLSGFQV